MRWNFCTELRPQMTYSGGAVDLLEGKHKCELGPAPLHRVHFEFPAQLQGHLPAHVQTQVTHATRVVPLVGGHVAAQRAEDVVERGIRNATTEINDRHADERLRALGLDLFGLHLDLEAVLRKLNGVRNQVHEDLLHPVRVSLHHLRVFELVYKVDFDVPLPTQNRQRLDRVCDQRGQADDFLAQAHGWTFLVQGHVQIRRHLAEHQCGRRLDKFDALF